jgi:hypothetical protein
MERTEFIFLHNKNTIAKGWIRTSVRYLSREGNATEKQLLQKTLGEGLIVSHDPVVFPYSGHTSKRNT